MISKMKPAFGGIQSPLMSGTLHRPYKKDNSYNTLVKARKMTVRN